MSSLGTSTETKIRQLDVSLHTTPHEPVRVRVDSGEGEGEMLIVVRVRVRY